MQSYEVLREAAESVGVKALAVRARRLGMHALRGLVHGTGVMLWFYAIKTPTSKDYGTTGYFPTYDRVS